MPIPQSILERIATFGRNLDSYVNPDYKEARVRQEFLDPLFAALGWDVSNSQGYAEAYKDVVHEETLRISGSGTTAPDYSFRIGGTRKFFVEAKKPSVYLKDDPEPALQLRRYSWSDKLSLGIVTDFQEFAIYDTRIKPKEGDKAAIARIFYCTYEQYAEKWDEIAGIFSREAVLKGSFDKYAATNKGKRGTTEFDDAFLADMEHWRELLARNLALRNAGLTQRELNFAVQRILDRIIFLRIAEDRGIETYGQLLALTGAVSAPNWQVEEPAAARRSQATIYPRLGEIFERADFRYNSGLFHFATEKGREEAPDKLTLRLELDDAPLKEIINSLYWPKSPYAFAVIPADILGHVYEQFLGKVIHLTPDHRAKVEEKPEVRKAGGVYYTPTYIVKYIVGQTVGPLVEGKSPKQVEKIKVLDPACGSGSFLLGAYDYLLDWHLHYYLDHDPATWAKKKNPPIYETAPNAHGLGQGSKNWLLTTAERKRILVANLFGVDIDAQAVEVTKLSLLLKVLEGEARELRGRQLDFHRVLPDLGNNIKCGNSLIGSDFYAQADLPDFDDEARIKINAFDWTHEFKPIMCNGGFDAIIGNPPYALVGSDQEESQDYFTSGRYRLTAYKTNLYLLFVERALALLAAKGRLGYIIPKSLAFNSYFEAARRILLTEYSLPLLVEIKEKVFLDAEVGDSLLLFAVKNRPNRDATTQYRIVKNIWPSETLISRFDAPQTDLAQLPSASFRRTTLRIPITGMTLHTEWSVSNGLNPGNVRHILFSASKASQNHQPLVLGRDLHRYHINWSGTWVNYDTSLRDRIKLSEIRSKPGMTAQARVDFALRSPEIFYAPKILVRKTADRIVACYDVTGFYFDSLSYSIRPRTDDPCDAKFVLGLLNSRLLSAIHEEFAQNKDKVFAKVSAENLKRLPLPKLDLKKKTDKSKHDAIVSHVERMLKLHADIGTAKSSDAQTHLQRDIAATDRAIDQLVYQLYGLTAEEIALVEAATAPAVAKTTKD